MFDVCCVVVIIRSTVKRYILCLDFFLKNSLIYDCFEMTRHVSLMIKPFFLVDVEEKKLIKKVSIESFSIFFFFNYFCNRESKLIIEFGNLIKIINSM